MRYRFEPREHHPIGRSAQEIKAHEALDAHYGNMPNYPVGHALAEKTAFARNNPLPATAPMPGTQPSALPPKNIDPGMSAPQPRSNPALDTTSQVPFSPVAAANTRNQMRAAGVFSSRQEHAPSGPLPFTQASTAPLPANPGEGSPDYPKYLAAVEAQHSGALASRGQGVEPTFTDPQRTADAEATNFGSSRVLPPTNTDIRGVAGKGQTMSTPYGEIASSMPKPQTWQEQLAAKYPALHQAGSHANTAFVSATKAAGVDPSSQDPAMHAKAAQIAATLAQQNPEHYTAGADGSYPAPSKPGLAQNPGDPFYKSPLDGISLAQPTINGAQAPVQFAGADVGAAPHPKNTVPETITGIAAQKTGGVLSRVAGAVGDFAKDTASTVGNALYTVPQNAIAGAIGATKVAPFQVGNRSTSTPNLGTRTAQERQDWTPEPQPAQNAIASFGKNNQQQDQDEDNPIATLTRPPKRPRAY